MGKTIKPLRDSEIGDAPELPKEVTGPIDPEEVLELNDKVDGPIDDKLADLLEEAESETARSTDSEADPDAETAPKSEAKHQKSKEADKSSDEDGFVDDEQLNDAIDEIVAEESDKVLAAEDEERLGIEDEIKPKKQGKFKKWLVALWSNPRSRWAVIASFAAVLLALALIPNSRYLILNTARVRSGLQLKVVDASTLQPLKNVTVKAGGTEAQTGSDGVAKLAGVKLGRTKLVIEKRAFATYTRDITVGWGSNPLGDVQVDAVGVQYTFYVKDFLSGKPIEMAEATSGDGNASSDKDGKLVLTMDTAEMEDAAQLSVQISADSYRTETVNITVNNKDDQTVELVPSRRPSFVTKRSGKYDLYGVDADGKNERLLAGGSGLERDDMVIVPHARKHMVAFISTRENTRNQSGYLLSTLYLVDTDTADIMKIDQSEQIQIIGWSSSGRLIYVKIAAGASGTDPKRHRLISFNGDDYSDVKELASSNAFNDVLIADDKVYYAPSNIFNENSSPAAFVIKPDGNDKKQILDREVFTMVRSAYDTLYLSAGPDWFRYTLGGSAESAQAPSSTSSRVYMDSPDGKSSLWVDNRDGRGVLIRYDKQAREESELYAQGGLKLPVYWLNKKYVVFRVSDGKETADYLLNTEGGQPRKIVDVTGTAGISRWYYY